MLGGSHIMITLQDERPAVAVVSLPSAHARRAQFAKFAADTPVPWTFFDARTAIAQPLRYHASIARRVHGRELSDGELGAYASHHAVWRQLVDSNQQQIIVLEDDVVADWPFIAQLATLDLSAMGIDYLRLFTKIPPRFRKLRRPFLDRYHHLIRITGFALGTQAYLLTRQGAQRLLKHAEQIESPVDAYMDKYWRHGVPNLALYPFPGIRAIRCVEHRRIAVRQTAYSVSGSDRAHLTPASGARRHGAQRARIRPRRHRTSAAAQIAERLADTRRRARLMTG